ncbi:DUF4916 domain-containing protein [Microbacterium binotii]|uniref:Nudix hydrolase domain-containing protein n=1 Tax=Microbacterium binotii TaxID=462710 RepID=A0ABN3PFF3_9MICO
MTFLPRELYDRIEQSVPIACVDFVPMRANGDGPREIGLILRDSPHGQVWCHLGGRIHRGETIADAIRRHARETVGVAPELPLNPQPDYVYEWFPTQLAPTDGTAFGDDPRKQAIGLSFVVELPAGTHPANEALRFEYFSVSSLPSPLWPGCAELFQRMGVIAGQAM